MQRSSFGIARSSCCNDGRAKMGILKGIVCEEDKEARENNAITFFSDSDHSRARRYDALITSRRVLERHLRFDSRYESLVHSLPFVRVHIRSSSCLRCAMTLHRISLPRQIDIKSKLVQSNLGHDQAISRRSFRIKRFRSK